MLYTSFGPVAGWRSTAHFGGSPPFDTCQPSRGTIPEVVVVGWYQIGKGFTEITRLQSVGIKRHKLFFI